MANREWQKWQKTSKVKARKWWSDTGRQQKPSPAAPGPALVFDVQTPREAPALPKEPQFGIQGPGQGTVCVAKLQEDVG